MGPPTPPTDGLPVGRGLSRRMWDANAMSAWRALHHPFVRALADGTLPRPSFCFYIQQDAAFLEAFGAAYDAARREAERAGDDAEAVATLTTLRTAVTDELRLHESYARRWGLSPADLAAKPADATRAYTDFLSCAGDASGQEAGSKARVACILAAMTPCSRLYGWLGCVLARAGAGRAADGSRPYGDWIATYSSAEYLVAPAAKEALLDRLVASADEATLARLYARAMDLELRFFTAALTGPGEALPDTPHPARALVIDFDETLTTRDTTPSIIDAVVATAADAADARGDDESGAELREDRRMLTAALVRLYSAERAALFDGCFGGGENPPPSPFSQEAAETFTARLSAFDRAANGRAVEAGILAGAPAVDAVLHTAGVAAATSSSSPLFRPGAVAALRSAFAAGIPVAILSVSWSTSFVVGALQGAGLPAHAAADWPPRPLSSSSLSLSPPSIAVFANDLATDTAGTSSGALIQRCQCAEDKLELLQALAGGSSGPGPAVYVGDAPSDLAALLSADMGLVVGDSAPLRRAAAGVGAELVPLAAVPVSGRADRRGVLFTTSAWDEVAAFAVRGAEVVTVEDLPLPTTHHPRRTNPPRVLSIAGSDSGGGAGIQADIKTCAARGVYAATAITAVTVQNSAGVAGVHSVPPRTVAAQIDAVLGDIGADAVKTGMLPTAECVAAVADALEAIPEGGRPPIVVDPVLVSTSGDALAAGGVGAAIVARLFPLATVVTPNLVEAASLLGRDVGELQGSVEAVEEAAAALAALGPRWVLVKGGHSGVGQGGPVVDVLHDGRSATRLAAPRVDTPVSHGTGCTLATALAAGLATGLDVPAAAAAAKAFVHGALAASAGLRVGRGPQFAMHHGYATVDWSAYGAAKPPGLELATRPALDLSVYAVTDPALDAAAGRTTADAARLAADGGATIVQIRDKSGDPAALVSDAAAAVAAVSGRAALLVNDRVDAALAAGADGAHVGQSDLPAAGARAALGPRRLLGVSVKTVAQALAAQAAGADYLGAGAIAGTTTKADASVIGLDGLAAICRAVSIPVVAIGGVGPANAAACIEAGAAGVAVVSCIYGAGVDVVAATRQLRDVVDAALLKRGG